METKTGRRKQKTSDRFSRSYVLAFCGRSGSSTAKKWFVPGSSRGKWDPREGQQPFRPNPNGSGDRTITLRRLLIGADEIILVRFDVYIASYLLIFEKLVFGWPSKFKDCLK